MTDCSCRVGGLVMLSPESKTDLSVICDRVPLTICFCFCLFYFLFMPYFYVWNRPARKVHVKRLFVFEGIEFK